MGDERGSVLRVDVGTTAVLVLPERVDASAIEAVISELTASLDSNAELETVYLDVRHVAGVDEPFLRALSVWAQALDDEGILLRIRGPQAAVRESLRRAGVVSLIEGH